MAVKRLHVTIPRQLYADLQRLAARWGLDTSNTIKHCIARAVDAEFGNGKDSRTAENKRGPSEKHDSDPL